MQKKLFDKIGIWIFWILFGMVMCVCIIFVMIYASLVVFLMSIYSGISETEELFKEIFKS